MLGVGHGGLSTFGGFVVVLGGLEGVGRRLVCRGGVSEKRLDSPALLRLRRWLREGEIE